MITELEDIQDMLGSIHDIDITIAKSRIFFMTRFQKEIQNM